MDEEQAVAFLGFLFCLFGILAFIQLQISASIFCFGFGLILVAVALGHDAMKSLFETLKDIFENIVDLVLHMKW